MRYSFTGRHSVNVLPTPLSEVLVLEPVVYQDERGFFFESFNKEVFDEIVGKKYEFVQDNISRSKKGVLRGLHYQLHEMQGKLVQVLQGTIFDVAIDIRRKSPQFMQWIGVELSEENKKQLWIPPGYAHGFLVLSDYADIQYKVTNFRAAQWERAIRWNDPTLSIQWPDERNPILSLKDREAPFLKDAEIYT